MEPLPSIVGTMGCGLSILEGGFKIY